MTNWEKETGNPGIRGQRLKSMSSLIQISEMKLLRVTSSQKFKSIDIYQHRLKPIGIAVLTNGESIINCTVVH